MPTEGMLAYLSAAPGDAAWAGALHRDLERCLGHAGAAGRVFWEAADIAPGTGIVGAQQEGLDRARCFLLVVTPEALADRRMTDLWQSFHRLAQHDPGRRLVPVIVEETPLPPFLDGIRPVVFDPQDPDGYRRAVGELVAAVLARSEAPELPDDLEALPFPDRGLPTELRRSLVDWLTPVMRQPAVVLRGVADSLGLPGSAFLNHPSAACAASSAIVLATGKDDPVLAALRLVDQLEENLRGIESEDRLRQLGPLREKLAARREAGAPETGLLAAWRRKVSQDHEKLVDFFQQRHELDLLDRVYVELTIEADTRQLDPEKSFSLPRGSFTLGELLELDPAEVSWVTRRWVVRGDPGSGKTTLLRHLAARPVQASPHRWVPVFQSLPVLLRTREFLLDRIERQMGRADYRGMAAVLEREGQEGRLLLLLDGLDEVEDQEEAETLLRQLSERWPRTPLVVTTRPIGYRRFDATFRELELQPLDRERRFEFLARWFGRASGTRDETRAGQALAELEEPGLRDLSGNPLYLTLMALLLEQRKTPSRHRAALFDQIFELLLQGRHKHDRVEPIERPETVHAVLRLLAWGMTLDNRDAAPIRELEERVYREELDDLRAELRKVPRWDRHLGLFLEDVAHKVGILGPHDGEDADWRFWHRTFREALTAERLHEIHASGGDGVLALSRQITGQESRWAEPFALLAGRVEQPDALVRSLVEANRALGLRALATAQGVSDEALLEILELSGDWKDRRKVYEQIPDQLDDAEGSLQLIDRLRRRTRDGNDLYFLDLAAAAVAERWPEEGAEAAARLRARFYEHIPPPEDEDLFRRVETRDGQVSLWREIPAGEGWIGSPEGVGHDDERPRHRATMVRPFWLAAVAVTNEQYAAFDPEKPWQRWEGVEEEELPHHPRVNVTWYEAVSFCRWLSSLPGFEDVRLPTEEEWEYACRAGSATAYWTGDGEDAFAEVGWYVKNSGNRAHRVGEKPANPWGLYDVHGNVWEWTASTWEENYSGREGGITVDPAGEPADLAAPPGGGRVMRGGGCGDGADGARSAYRSDWDPDIEWLGVGFRLLAPSPPA